MCQPEKWSQTILIQALNIQYIINSSLALVSIYSEYQEIHVHG